LNKIKHARAEIKARPKKRSQICMLYLSFGGAGASMFVVDVVVVLDAAVVVVTDNPLFLMISTIFFYNINM
jgi:hypothetical protein